MALPHDPELEPVPAAKAFMAIAAAERSPTQQRKAAPVVAPAEPDAWRVVVPLAHALVVDGERLETITVRRITGGDIARLIMDDDDETSLNLRTRALMCGVHPAVLEGLWADDYEAVAVACRPFLPRLVADVESGLAAAIGDPDL